MGGVNCNKLTAQCLVLVHGTVIKRAIVVVVNNEEDIEQLTNTNSLLIKG